MSAYDLQMAEGHVNSAAHILELAQTASKPMFPNKSIHPVNCLVERQRFHSTRKKRKRTIRLTKPSLQERIVVMEHLQENKPLYKDKGIVYTAATEGDKILLLQYVNDVYRSNYGF